MNNFTWEMNIGNRKKEENTVDYAQINEITKENKTYMKN